MSTKSVPVGQATTTPVEQAERATIDVETYVDENGYVQNAGFVLKKIPALEKGSMDGPKAIVLHRTDSKTLASPLQSFEKGIGTHFIVDKDGTVYQTASLLKKTHHVGKIKSRCYEGGACPADEAKLIKSWGWAPTKVHDHEKVKDYPSRYPMNEDSVGIEVVADHDGSKWEAPTAEQSKSIRHVISVLKAEYGVQDSDIYEHDKISYKTSGEGEGLYSIDAVGAASLVQPGKPVP
ncbi:peptidoglycan recognition protein family protein [Pseudomonas sp. Hp2]|uniref:peptidoglycan recognition protein family protein n=1 Tax=Pseudomonas sp. Hp2 TaxID=701189 RepID=UPI001128A159|nr:N-acetylmuramoyl-L-alanine amidase [Pseudomonas sp. Hp2]